VLWKGLAIPEQGNRARSLRSLDRQYAGGEPGLILKHIRELISKYQGKHQALPAPRPRALSPAGRIFPAALPSQPALSTRFSGLRLFFLPRIEPVQ
jgi:hypothetical protein